MRPILIFTALLAVLTAGRADSPKSNTVTYRLSLDRPAAERFRDAVASADVQTARKALDAAATDPAQKAVVALAAFNIESFKRRLSQDGAIGANGIEIVLTVHTGPNDAAPLVPGKVDDRPPSVARQWARRAARRVGEVLLNPWSWEIKPRD